MHGEGRDQFRFAAGFETEMKSFAGIDDFFDHLAQLIDLDREHAAVGIAIAELGNRRFKRAVDRFDPVAQQILKPDDERKTQSPRARFVDHFENVDRAAGVLERPGNDVAVLVDGEVVPAPAVDVVRGDGRLNVPLGLHLR